MPGLNVTTASTSGWPSSVIEPVTLPMSARPPQPAVDRIAARPEHRGKTIVNFDCSTGERSLSTPLSNYVGMNGSAASHDFTI